MAFYLIGNECRFQDFSEMYQDRQDEFQEEYMLSFGQQPVMNTTQRLIGMVVPILDPPEFKKHLLHK